MRYEKEKLPDCIYCYSRPVFFDDRLCKSIHIGINKRKWIKRSCNNSAYQRCNGICGAKINKIECHREQRYDKDGQFGNNNL